jgi:hypothetical protein
MLWLLIGIMLWGWLYQRLYTQSTTYHHLTEHIWWHWQNLNMEDKKKGSGLIDGRAWLRGPRWNFHVEWHFFRTDAALTLHVDGEGTTFHLALPFLISLYVGIDEVRWLRLKGWDGRDLGIRVFDWAIWFDFWDSQNGNGPSRNFCFHIDDFFLGRSVYSDRTLEDGIQVAVEMPEGNYPATVRLFESSWKRPRWPWPKIVKRAEIEMQKPIPIPGKGENSWDMDDDATFSMVCAASTVQEAVVTLQRSILRDRERYGGSEWVPTI